MSSATKVRLEEDLEKKLKTLQEKTAALGATQDSAQDWHDNAAYDLLQQELTVLETDIAKIRAALNNAVIVEPRQETEDVQVGNTVEVFYEGDEDVTRLTILGSRDNGTRRDWISPESPLGSLLLGKKVGDVVVLQNGMSVEVKTIFPGEF